MPLFRRLCLVLEGPTLHCELARPRLSAFSMEGKRFLPEIPAFGVD